MSNWTHPQNIMLMYDEIWPWLVIPPLERLCLYVKTSSVSRNYQLWAAHTSGRKKVNCVLWKYNVHPTIICMYIGTLQAMFSFIRAKKCSSESNKKSGSKFCSTMYFAHAKNVNVSVYSLNSPSEIPIEFSRLNNLRLWYWNSFLYSLISSGENSAFAHFAAATANHYNC